VRGRITGQQGGDLVLRARRPQAVQQPGHLARVVEGDVRAGDGEQITENTLIRMAVDMLLGSADRLRSSTEDELRESVTS
jgi:hypothetical protein